MAAPSAKGLFQRAIGESGSAIVQAEFLRQTLAERAADDARLLKERFGVETAAQLRALPAKALTEAFSKPDQNGGHSFVANVDGAFLEKSANAIFAAGEQNDVPLLAGWNRDEIFVATATPETLKDAIEKNFGAAAPDCLHVYAATQELEAARAMTDLLSDRFMGWGTWAWIEAQINRGKQPVYRFSFDQARPVPQGKPERGAYHSAEIVYVFGELDSEAGTPWMKEHYGLSVLMRKYWANFARTGNPNGAGLPEWPRYTKAAQWPVMHLASQSEAKPDAHRARYQFLNSIWGDK